MLCFFFFFNDTATTEIYTLSLHDALPICLEDGVVEVARPHVAAGVDVHRSQRLGLVHDQVAAGLEVHAAAQRAGDRKSTRLNSSHANISYAVFCLKKKNESTAVNPSLLAF